MSGQQRPKAGGSCCSRGAWAEAMGAGGDCSHSWLVVSCGRGNGGGGGVLVPRGGGGPRTAQSLGGSTTHVGSPGVFCRPTVRQGVGGRTGLPGCWI